jgi:pectin methylesterase-like acyl-CoA thioesterase
MQNLNEIFPSSTLRVGPGQTYTTLGAAINAAQDGDTLLVEAGTYTDSLAALQTRITLKAVGGMVVLQAA